MQSTQLSNSRTVSSPQREIPSSLAVTRIFSFSKPLTTTNELFLWICLLWTFHINESHNTWPFVCDFFHLA